MGGRKENRQRGGDGCKSELVKQKGSKRRKGVKGRTKQWKKRIMEE